MGTFRFPFPFSLMSTSHDIPITSKIANTPRDVYMEFLTNGEDSSKRLKLVGGLSCVS